MKRLGTMPDFAFINVNINVNDNISQVLRGLEIHQSFGLWGHTDLPVLQLPLAASIY